MWLFHILINVDLTWWGSCEVHNHNTYQMSPNFLVKSFFVHSFLIPWHHLQENNMWMLLLVHNIQMLWYDWCEIHNLMPKSDWRKIHTLMQISVWCEIRTLMWWSDWCGHYTTLQANKFFFFCKKKNNLKMFDHWYPMRKHTTQQSFFFNESSCKSECFFVSNFIPLVNNWTVQNSWNKVITNTFNLNRQVIVVRGTKFCFQKTSYMLL